MSSLTLAHPGVLSLYENQNYIQDRGLFLKKYGNKKYNIFDVLIKIIKSHKKEAFHCLDVGCGTGALLRKISSQFPRSMCYGIDTVYNALGAQVENINYHLFDGINFPVYTQKFDYIFCTNMFYHVRYKKRFLENLFGLLTPTGHIFITTKSKNNLPVLRDIYHKVCTNMGILPSLNYDHTRSFWAEKGVTMLNKIIKSCPLSLETISLTSTIIVDNLDDLLAYVFSTPMWDNPDPGYRETWKTELSKYSVFFDFHSEAIFHLYGSQEKIA